MDTETAPRPPLMTTLTTTTRANGGTSLSEALANSVADFVCSNRQHPQQPPRTPNEDTTASQKMLASFTLQSRTPSPTKTAATKAITNKVTPKAAPAPPPATTKSTPRTKPVPGTINTPPICNATATRAPIISGTAAAILALQTVSFDATNDHAIVSTSEFSNSSSNDSSADQEGCGGNRLGGSAPASAASSPATPRMSGPAISSNSPESDESRWVLNSEEQYLQLAKSAASTAASASTSSPNESPKGKQTPSTAKSFMNRYSDGAPIIAGTAAAQMAIATAARIAASRKSDSSPCEAKTCDVEMNHYNFSEEITQFGSAIPKFSSPNVVSRDSTVDEHPSGGNAKSGCANFMSSTNVGGGAVKSVLLSGSAFSQNKKNTPTKALSWVDHAPRVTPDDWSTSNFIPEGSALPYQVSTPASNGFHTKPDHDLSTHPTASPLSCVGGGMDILADIISHVPPMIVPATGQPQTSTPMVCQSVSMEQSSLQQHYPLHQSQSMHHSPKQQAPPMHNAQATPNQANGQRVSAIPSYQEIYQEMREMGQAVYPSEQHYHGMQAETSTAPEQQYYDSHPQHYHRTNHPSQEDRLTSSTSYSVEQVAMPSSCVVETVDPPPPSRTAHRAPTTCFGHVDGGEIVEGKELYTRKDLVQAGAHALEHKDVHGNMKEGADSIVISNLERELREGDGLLWLSYSCDRANGGGALCRSYLKKRAIRVFRSSTLGGRFAAPYLDEEGDDDIGYRYDGLYMVRTVWDVNGNETESFPTTGEDGWHTFFLCRLLKKPLDVKGSEPGMQYNQLGLQELWGSIQKMRGVRRPKKFEIPQPPMKLPPFKRASITGDNKDRKAASIRPPPKPKPTPTNENTTSCDNNVTVQSSRHIESEDSSDSSDDEISKQIDVDAVSDFEISSHPQRIPPASAQKSPSTMSRPRMLSVQDPKPSIQLNQLKQSGPGHSSSDGDESGDSSDSEGSTSNAYVRRKKTPAPKRLKTETPLKKTRPPEKKPPAVFIDTSSFFPKRTSAAKAEAANRDLLVKNKKPNVKRKTTTPTGRGVRKKAKQEVEVEAELEMDNSSSSSDDGHVDHAVLTVGSRVLVVYKGSLFKATIRKRREKNGRHDFLIHYDGNKKSNVHWVPIERIPEILSIAVDATPTKNPTPNRNSSSKKKSSPRNSYDEDSDGNNDDDEEKSSPKLKADSGGPVSIDLLKTSKGSKLSEKLAPEIKSSSPVIDEVTGDRDGPDTLDDAKTSSAPVAYDNDRSDSAEVGEDSSLNEIVESIANSAIVASPEMELLKTKDGISETDDLVPEPENTTDTAASNASSSESSKNARPTVFSDVCVAETVTTEKDKPSNADVQQNGIHHPGITLVASLQSEVEVDSNEKSSALSSVAGDDGSDEEPDSSSMNCDDAKSQESSGPISEIKYPVGSSVYAEYGQVFYSSKILKTRKKKKSGMEYYVHYQGFKNASNRWVKENTLHEVNETTTKCYEEQRLILPADMLNGTDQSGVGHFKMTTRRNKASGSSSPSTHTHATRQKPRRPRSDTSDLIESPFDDIEPGVAFLPGSMVFVEWSAGLYLAKMVKKRFSGDRMEYMVSYDGFQSNHDAWVSIHKIYEVNHQTKRVFKRLKSEIMPRDPPGTKRETRSSLDAGSTPVQKRESRRKKDDDCTTDADQLYKSNGEIRQAESQLDMEGIPSGVDFLPGSTLFAERNDGLCLAKMLKKRGKGDYMEYSIQYMGLKKDETAWISTALVYEINPQTKRMYRKFSNSKKL